jgi:hypothetical protein
MKNLNQTFIKMMGYVFAASTAYNCTTDSEMLEDEVKFDPADHISDVKLDNALLDDMGDRTARSIAGSLSEFGVLEVISREVQKELTGDYETVVQSVIYQKPNAENGRVSDVSIGETIFGSDIFNDSRTVPTLIDSLSLLYPLLDVSVPLYDQYGLSKDPSETIVVYVPRGYDDQGEELLVGYKTDGTKVQVDKHLTNLESVIVLKENERLIPSAPEADPAIVLQTYFRNARMDASAFEDVKPVIETPTNTYFSTTLVPIDGGGGSGGSTGGGSGSGSSNQKYIYWSGIYCADLGEWEPAIGGKPEFYMAIETPTEEITYENPIYVTAREKRSKMDGEWWYFNTGIKAYDTQNDAERYALFLKEEDNGTIGEVTLEFSTKIKGVTIKPKIEFPLRNNDDEIFRQDFWADLALKTHSRNAGTRNIQIRMYIF